MIVRTGRFYKSAIYSLQFSNLISSKMYGSINYQRLSFLRFFFRRSRPALSRKSLKGAFSFQIFPRAYACHCSFFYLTQHPPPLPSHWARDSSITRFLDHTQQRNTIGMTPLDEWSALRRDLYLTTLTTDRYPCPPCVGFEPTISADKRHLNLKYLEHWKEDFYSHGL